MKKDKQSYKPRLLALELTRQCRFNCQHCRADAERTAPQDEMTTEQWKRILESIAAYEKCVVIMTGGEPTERDDLIELIEYADRVGLRVVMATCGYALDDASLARLKDAGVQALSFSLDGATAETHDRFRRTPGAFDTVTRAAQATRRAGLRFQINTTITRTNLAEVPAIAELARELGAAVFNPFILVPTGRGDEIREEILEPNQYSKLLGDLLKMRDGSPVELRVTCGPQYARLYREEEAQRSDVHISGCMGGRGFGFISHRGDIQTCGFLDISAGNLIENGYDFAAIWDKSTFLHEIRDVKGYEGKCGACAYAKVCGGCRARAYTMTGDYLAEDPVCWYESKETK